MALEAFTRACQSHWRAFGNFRQDIGGPGEPSGGTSSRRNASVPATPWPLASLEPLQLGTEFRSSRIAERVWQGNRLLCRREGGRAFADWSSSALVDT
jgi:hypothetical protein